MARTDIMFGSGDFARKRAAEMMVFGLQYQALNSLFLGEQDNARVYIRRATSVQEQLKEEKAESLISDAGVLDATGGKRPVLDIEPMKNRSQMIVDMKSITDSVRTRLIRSRLFRFVDRSTAGADITIMDEQAQLGLTDPKKAVRPGRQSAAEMYPTASLTDMVTRVGRTTDHYYKFTMIQKDLRNQKGDRYEQT